MRLAIRQSGATSSAVKIHPRKGGVTKNGLRAWQRKGGALVQFFGSFAVALSTSNAFGRANSAALITVTSNAVFANVTGGVGTLSYAWTRRDAGLQPWVINDPTSEFTTFSTDCDQGDSFDAQFVCTVTDQSGEALTSSAVTVSCANIFYGGGYKGGQPPAPGTYYP